jgi:hypothetical protein
MSNEQYYQWVIILNLPKQLKMNEKTVNYDSLYQKYIKYKKLTI